jgi:hypothetical protein
MKIRKYVDVVGGPVYPIKATLALFDDSPNVMEQISSSILGETDFRSFVAKTM